MKLPVRLPAAVLACSLSCGPAFSQVRTVTVPNAQPAAGSAGAAAVSQALGPRSISLPALSIGAPSLPGIADAPSPQTLKPVPAPQVSAVPAASVLGMPAASRTSPAPALPTALALPAPAIRTSPAAESVKASTLGPVKDAQKARFQRRIEAIGRGFQEAGRSADSKTLEGGKAAADVRFDGSEGGKSFAQLLEESFETAAPAGEHNSAAVLLDSEAPRFTERQLRRVREASQALESAVEEAVGRMLPEGGFRVQSRGSSSRLTHDVPDPDYDIMVALPDSWTREQLHDFAYGRLAELKETLSSAIAEKSFSLFPGRAVRVKAGSYVQLSDPVTRTPDSGVYMLPVQVTGPKGETLLDMDLTLTNRGKYTNPYPEYFADQMRNVAELGGREAVESVLGSIRLAKRFFREVVGAYKVWRGGPSGVGVEQMIMQSGEVDAADKGRTVLEPGSFDKFMDRIYGIAYDERGQPRGLKSSRKRWDVHNPFREPENFLVHLSEKAWQRLANAARNYRMARTTGRPITFEGLRYRRLTTPGAAKKAKPAEKKLPVRRAAALTLRYESDKTYKKEKGVLGRLRDALKDEGIPLLHASISGQRSRKSGSYAVSLYLESGTDPAGLGRKAQEALQGIVGRPVRVEDGDRGRDGKRLALLLFLHTHSKPGRRKTVESVSKAVRRLDRRLGGDGRALTDERAGPGGEFMVRVLLSPGTEAEEALRKAEQLFGSNGIGMRLTGVSYMDGSAPQTDGPGAPGDEAPGKLTLSMLDEFTLTGPKPVERGDGFLYAQGAKALPEGLEASWAGRTSPEADMSGKSRIERSLLMRRGGRTYIMVSSFRPDGEPVMKPVRIPDDLAQGVISNTLVEVEFNGMDAVSVTPIGSYPYDVMVGRVVRMGGRLMLDALFRQGDAPLALYERMPLEGADGIREGEIVQAFVKPGYRGFTAVPMMRLGARITPEIAMREIALRHGARAYFEEAVIRQVEAQGRGLDAAQEFEKMRAEMAEKAPELRIEDMSGKPFITIDPVGAGDLDDAFTIEKHADGSFTWYLATADVAQYVPPGTPAFRAAARIGNTFYTPDKDGTPEYPMNQPVVSKYLASLLAGKDSLAMITRMRFSPSGEFLKEDSDVFLGKVRVQGRYTYDQVVELWKGREGHGIEHVEQVALARELAGGLDRSDSVRGKLKLMFQETRHRKQSDGSWRTEAVVEDPLASESHRLIEELKVYGNRVIAKVLEEITARFGIPHISRVHPPAKEGINKRLRKELSAIGVPWAKNKALWDFLNEVHDRPDLGAEVKETAQILALRTRMTAQYMTTDSEGHEGLALEAGDYDHPSTPIRRFADMYNRALLEAYLAGEDPRKVYDAVLSDLTDMGFRSLEEYMTHLNGRESAAKLMDRELDEFMAAYELAKPEHRGRAYSGYVKVLKTGRNAMAVIQLRELPLSLVLRGKEVGDLKLLDEVAVEVRGADPARLRIDAEVRKVGGSLRREQHPEGRESRRSRRRRR